MDVEHLWLYNAAELSRLNQPAPPGSSASFASNPLLSSAGISNDSNPDLIANLCNIADHRLYKIVKWCKSLPLFKNISVIKLNKLFFSLANFTFFKDRRSNLPFDQLVVWVAVVFLLFPVHVNPRRDPNFAWKVHHARAGKKYGTAGKCWVAIMKKNLFYNFLFFRPA